MNECKLAKLLIYSFIMLSLSKQIILCIKPLLNIPSEIAHLGHKCLPLPGSGCTSIGILHNLTVHLLAYFFLTVM